MPEARFLPPSMPSKRRGLRGLAGLLQADVVGDEALRRADVARLVAPLVEKPHRGFDNGFHLGFARFRLARSVHYLPQGHGRPQNADSILFEEIQHFWAKFWLLTCLHVYFRVFWSLCRALEGALVTETRSPCFLRSTRKPQRRRSSRRKRTRPVPRARLLPRRVARTPTRTLGRRRRRVSR